MLVELFNGPVDAGRHYWICCFHLPSGGGIQTSAWVVQPDLTSASESFSSSLMNAHHLLNHL
jgi:hypothetical protein